MNAKLFSDAMSEIDSKYYEEAMTVLQPAGLRKKSRGLRRAAACFAAAVLIGAVSFGAAFAASADFRDAVIGFFTGGSAEHGADGQGNYSVYFHDAGSAAPITVRAGQIYFTADGSETNITEQCSEASYYSREATDAEGNRHVILAGGTPDSAGWAELIFANDGAMMMIADYEGEEPEWLSAGREEFAEKYMPERE